ncbi:MAG: alpha,alpha-trehalase TreF [Gammaproteobacteria bacterium]|nr:MAG: alpha,alpha-trehalase TreF [Gammaproteobacteria bacterium]
MYRALLLLSIFVFSAYGHSKDLHAPQTPADIYGALFERVQIEKLFADGKTFVDATPKRESAAIMADFLAQNPTTRESLHRFVNANFDLPDNSSPVTFVSEHLPLRDHIKKLWSQLERPAFGENRGSSALGLPAKFIVPGGRFREVYYWDTYFTMIGLVADGRNDLVDSMLENFVSLIDRYGHIPNGTRSYYLSRSQPPFFALMIRFSKTTDKLILKKYLSALQQEHKYWMAGRECINLKTVACERVVKLPDGNLLNRYWDDRDTPRDESYAEDVATAKLSARPAAEVYRHLRAGAESGWDFSSRWLSDPNRLHTIHTTDIIPIDLNTLLWAQEKEISRLCNLFDDKSCEIEFDQKALKRAAAIRKYLWIGKEKRFADFDFRTQKITGVLSAATLYPLFMGLATQNEADAVALTTQRSLVASGGLRTTQIINGQQWDNPNGWAPLQWVGVTGLANYGKLDLAKNISARWIQTLNKPYRETGKLLEKYDVENRRPGGGGEYPLQDGFGWTNGVTRGLIERFADLDPDVSK